MTILNRAAHGIAIEVAAIFASKRILTTAAYGLSGPLLLCAAVAHGETTTNDNEVELAPVTVHASPLGAVSDELAAPAASLSGHELYENRQNTLGETLKSLPGVSASSFGPNASRPVMRGLDADRVRIMQNGVGTLDASSLSFDHAVAIDPFIIEQVDVIRGPAALRYGGNPIGGVVNAIDHRIPKEAIDGATGRGELSFGGAGNQKNGAAMIDAGNGVLTLHADVYRRESDDLDIPGYAVSREKSQRDGTPRTDRGRLVNSSAEADGGALGASLNFEHGYAGIAYSRFNNLYGTVAEPDVRIDQNSDRWDFASEINNLDLPINRLQFKLAYTDYMHRELEDGSVATTFMNKGLGGSLEAGHGTDGELSGVFGLQFQHADFSALGEEAFVPSNQTETRALYIYEELPLTLRRNGDLKLSLAGRAEHADIRSDGGGNFGPAQSASFRPNSLAAGLSYALDPYWTLSGNLSHSERAPSYFELFANGAHIATGQVEVGDPGLDEERSNGVEAALGWKAGTSSFRLSAYYNRFSNYISLQNSGNMVEVEPGEFFPEARFMAVPAVFKGVEAEGKFRIYDGNGTLDMRLRGDYVHATDSESDEPLPRIAPLQLAMGLDYAIGRFGSQLDVLHAFDQHRTARNELDTDGYTQVDLTLSYQLPSRFHLEAFVRGSNLLDEEIREHTSFLKDVAPLGGRALLFGLRGDF